MVSTVSHVFLGLGLGLGVFRAFRVYCVSVFGTEGSFTCLGFTGTVVVACGACIPFSLAVPVCKACG